jgi:rRNA small subunit aminocarboxypropyltransferase
MSLFPPTIIIRHRKENLKKCSLSGLEKRADMLFFSYPLKKPLPTLSNYILLSFDGPKLSDADIDKGIILIDGTWKYAATMQSEIIDLNDIPHRSIPNYKTAYPRKQTHCPYPEIGLSSIEALFITYQILKRDSYDLLEKYHFKNKFIDINFFK